MCRLAFVLTFESLHCSTFRRGTPRTCVYTHCRAQRRARAASEPPPWSRSILLGPSAGAPRRQSQRFWQPGSGCGPLPTSLAFSMVSQPGRLPPVPARTALGSHRRGTRGTCKSVTCAARRASPAAGVPAAAGCPAQAGAGAGADVDRLRARARDRSPSIKPGRSSAAGRTHPCHPCHAVARAPLRFRPSRGAGQLTIIT